LTTNSIPKEYKNPIPTADIVLRKSGEEHEKILIETRGRDPFKSKYSLPGGHVEYGETVEESILRELEEECGLNAKLLCILGVYSDPKRDPRGQRISTVFIGDCKGGTMKAGDDAASCEWMDLQKILIMRNRLFAFDHYKMLSDYWKWLKNKEPTFWSSKKD